MAEGTANVDPRPPVAVMLSKSTDGGNTWTTSVAIPFRYDNPRGGPGNSYARFAVSRAGALHMVYGINPDSGVAGATPVGSAAPEAVPGAPRPGRRNRRLRRSGEGGGFAPALAAS